MTRTDIQRMKKVDLIDILEMHGAPTDGSVGDLRQRATDVLFITDAPGAAKAVVDVVPVEGETIDCGMDVITTNVGTRGRGIIPVGTAMTVTLEEYSPRWMRPADEQAAQKLKG